MSEWKKTKWNYYEDFVFLQKDEVSLPDYGIPQDSDSDPAPAPKAEGKVCINR